jgi:hypothetical protein
MKYLKVVIILTVLSFNASAVDTGGKKEPPLATVTSEKSLIDVIIDALTFQ